MKTKILLAILIATSGIVQAQTFSASPGQLIPDYPNSVSFTINVSGLPSIIDGSFGLEQNCINITHTWDADLEAHLTAPDGSSFTLFNGIGGDGDNFTNTCFRQDAPAGLISNYSPPFTGTYVPMGDMGVVNNGQDPNGTWTLTFQDNAGQDEGWMIDWSITFGNNPAQPYVFPGTTLPLVILTSSQGIPNEPKVLGHMQIVNKGNGLTNFYTDSVYEFEGDLMVELQGYTGPYYPKKNYDFDLVDGSGNKMDAPLLGMPAENDWLFKAEYLDPTLLYNTIAYEFSRRMGQYAPRTKFCELFLNGEYQGVYTLTEKVKQGPNRVDIDELDKEDTTGIELTGGYVIEMNINGDAPDWTSQYLPINYATSGQNVEFKHVDPKTDSIQIQQHNYIRAWVDSFENALHQPDFQDEQEGFRKWIDLESFIDFMIVNEFSTNYDSYGRSTYLFKEKNTEDGLLHIGPPWDYDRGFCCVNDWVWEQTHPYWPFPDWWDIFHDDSLFQKQEWCRWNSLRNHNYTTDSFMIFIDSLHTLLDGAAERNHWLWSPGTDWDQQVIDLQNRLTDRLNWMDANINASGVQLPVISIDDATLCEGEILSADIGSSYKYDWNTGEETPEIEITQSGNYSVTVEGNYGCYSVDDANITITPTPLPTFTSQTGSGNLDWNFIPDFTNGTSYNWDFGDGSSSNLMQPNHDYTSGGIYVVTLDETFPNNCNRIFSDTIAVWGVGLNEVVHDFQIYPNPFDDFIRISPIPTTQFHLFDVIGNELQITMTKNSDGMILHTKNLAPGIYLINIKTEEEVSLVFKLLKE